MDLQAISLTIQANVPAMLWGEPGIGKSATVDAMARQYGATLLYKDLQTADPTDLGGMPLQDGWREPDIFVQACNLLEKGSDVWLLADEVNTAPLSVLNAWLTISQQRRAGQSLEFGELRIISAGNPPDTSAGGTDLPAANANRYAHFDFAITARQWVEGMRNGWTLPNLPKLPEGWEAGIEDATALVTAFHSAVPGHLQNMPKDDTARGKAWPSMRTWDYAIRLLAAADSVGASRDTKEAVMASCVGMHAVAAFTEWERTLALPDPEAVLKSPDAFMLPSRADLRMLVLRSISRAISDEPTQARLDAAWRILYLAAHQGGTDAGAVECRTLLNVAESNGLQTPNASIMPYVDMLKAAGLL